MTTASGVVFLEGETVWYRGPKSIFPVELTDVTARMVSLLSRQVSGMNGAQLARELGVTPSAITKAARHLVKLGIIRRDSLPVSQNVKLYSLTIRVMNESAFAEIRKTTSPTLLRILTQSFGGEEKMALFYAGEVHEYLKTLPESRWAGVMEKLMKEITGREMENKD
jgi:DNA-binding MarR family transcriptional regulator